MKYYTLIITDCEMDYLSICFEATDNDAAVKLARMLFRANVQWWVDKNWNPLYVEVNDEDQDGTIRCGWAVWQGDDEFYTKYEKIRPTEIVYEKQ